MAVLLPIRSTQATTIYAGKWKAYFVEDLDLVPQDYSADGKRRIQTKNRGDIRGAEFSVKDTGTTNLEFFQHDRDGEQKGFVELNPMRQEP